MQGVKTLATLPPPLIWLWECCSRSPVDNSPDPKFDASNQECPVSTRIAHCASENIKQWSLSSAFPEEIFTRNLGILDIMWSGSGRELVRLCRWLDCALSLFHLTVYCRQVSLSHIAWNGVKGNVSHFPQTSFKKCQKGRHWYKFSES